MTRPPTMTSDADDASEGGAIGELFRAARELDLPGANMDTGQHGINEDCERFWDGYRRYAQRYQQHEDDCDHYEEVRQLFLEERWQYEEKMCRCHEIKCLSRREKARLHLKKEDLYLKR